MGSHVNENEKKNRKKFESMCFLWKLQKTCQRMAQGKQQPKFERNPCIRFRDNCDTDGRRAEITYHDLCWQSQAELKIECLKASA